MSFQDLEAGHGPGFHYGSVNGKHQDSAQTLAAGIFQINTAISTFHRLVNCIGTSKDTPQLREKLLLTLKLLGAGIWNSHKTRLHIGQLVKETSDKLKQASESDHRVEADQNKKLADARLAKDFQAILKEYQKAQRLVVEKETSYTPFLPEVVLPSRYAAGDVRNDQILEKQALLIDSKRQDVLLLDNEIAFNKVSIEKKDQGVSIEKKDQGVHEIQQQFGEVNDIFKDLAVLVHEEGTVIDDVGSNVDGANVTTAHAKTQLLQAAKTQESDSSLTCLMLVILAIVILIVVFVLLS